MAAMNQFIFLRQNRTNQAEEESLRKKSLQKKVNINICTCPFSICRKLKLTKLGKEIYNSKN